jgi:hypothetical protein
VNSLHIAMEKDTWINWCPIEDRLNAMREMIIRGMLKEPYV